MASFVERVLILCKTYPSPSAKYAETSCVAGLTAGGRLVRLFPVPFRLVADDQQFRKWQWIEVRLEKARDDHRPESHLIPIVLQAANGTRPSIAVYGTDYPTRDGTCVRDYIHVCDLAQAHVLAVRYLIDDGKSDVFNLGNGIGFTVLEVLKAAEKVVGHEIPTVLAGRRAGDPATLVASSEKARSVLGWKPEFADIETILETAWQWHSGHPNGYGK